MEPGSRIFTERGPGGGFDLLDIHQEGFAPLKAEELRALLSIDTPPPLADLGLDRDFRSALLKVGAILARFPGIGDTSY